MFIDLRYSHLQNIFFVYVSVQLLDKLSIRASDGPLKLLKVGSGHDVCILCAAAGNDFLSFNLFFSHFGYYWYKNMCFIEGPTHT